MFSKKATKIDEIFTGDLTLCSKCQIDGEDFINFCGLFIKHKLYLGCHCGTLNRIRLGNLDRLGCHRGCLPGTHWGLYSERLCQGTFVFHGYQVLAHPRAIKWPLFRVHLVHSLKGHRWVYPGDGNWRLLKSLQPVCWFWPPLVVASLMAVFNLAARWKNGI